MIDTNRDINDPIKIDIYNKENKYGYGTLHIYKDTCEFITASTVRGYSLEELEGVVNIMRTLKNLKPSEEPIPVLVNKNKALELLNKRTQLKENKQYAEADLLRDQIQTMGFKIIDTPTGSILHEPN